MAVFTIHRRFTRISLHQEGEREGVRIYIIPWFIQTFNRLIADNPLDHNKRQ